jgi:hypothetical protein
MFGVDAKEILQEQDPLVMAIILESLIGEKKGF